jgi:hypothetical protein
MLENWIFEWPGQGDARKKVRFWIVEDGGSGKKGRTGGRERSSRHTSAKASAVLRPGGRWAAERLVSFLVMENGSVEKAMSGGDGELRCCKKDSGGEREPGRPILQV